MDNHDKEFETFLEQFELRHQRPFPQENPVEAGRSMQRWVLAAAAVIVASLLSIPLLRHFFQATYPGAIVETAGDSSYRTGETVAGTTIRSGAFEPLSLRLEDGTRVEMRGQSELALESANDGVRVRLSSGSILVTAAKQRGGPDDEPRTEKPQSPPPPPVPPPAKKAPRSLEPQSSTDAGRDGPGKEILNRACSQCHVPSAVETTRYTTREAYASLIDRQRSMGAGLTDDESKELVDYLFRTYGMRN